jgi:hypothetical protein
MSRQINRISHMASWTKPADEWSRAKAAEMHRDGYAAGVIIDKLEAYGIGFYAAQALVRRLKNGGAS